MFLPGDIGFADGSTCVRPTRRPHVRGWSARSRRLVPGDDRPRLAEALATTSMAENMAGRPAVAAQLLDEAETIAAGMPDPLPVQVIPAEAVHAFFQRDVTAAAEFAVAGEQLCRASGTCST